MKIGDEVKIVKNPKNNNVVARYLGVIGKITNIHEHFRGLNLAYIDIEFNNGVTNSFYPDEFEIVTSEKPKQKSFKAIVKFKNKPQEVYENLTEIHYNYPSADNRPQTAFESNILKTGYTVYTDQILEMEIVPE